MGQLGIKLQPPPFSAPDPVFPECLALASGSLSLALDADGECLMASRSVTTIRTSCSLVTPSGGQILEKERRCSKMPTTNPAHMPAIMKCCTMPPGLALPVAISFLTLARSWEATCSQLLQAGSI